MKKIFKISGMHCESCAKVIKMELDEKVNSINADYKKGACEVDFDEEIISEKQIKNAIESLGYKIK